MYEIIAELKGWISPSGLHISTGEKNGEIARKIVNELVGTDFVPAHDASADILLSTGWGVIENDQLYCRNSATSAQLETFRRIKKASV